MTIKDALDRAKRLRKDRLEEEARQRTDSPVVPAPSKQDLSSVQPAPRPPIKFEPLNTTEISLAACQSNRILVTAAQLSEVPQVDAAFRLLRSRVQQRLKRHDWNSLAVVSPGQNDGKTFTSINLALSIAREKQRPVYLIDLDMRNPSVCNYLGVEDVRPLADYFSGEVSAAEVLFQTSVSHLIIAGSQKTVEGASELLAGPRMGELLAHIRARSPDAIVITDLPPVTVTDEALVVAALVDAILVVVSEGKTPRDSLARTLSVLSDFTIAGVVNNRSNDHHVSPYEQYYG
jgi:Mrp family chromosome partitioning ATPase